MSNAKAKQKGIRKIYFSEAHFSLLIIVNYDKLFRIQESYHNIMKNAKKKI